MAKNKQKGLTTLEQIQKTEMELRDDVRYTNDYQIKQNGLTPTERAYREGVLKSFNAQGDSPEASAGLAGIRRGAILKSRAINSAKDIDKKAKKESKKASTGKKPFQLTRFLKRK